MSLLARVVRLTKFARRSCPSDLQRLSFRNTEKFTFGTALKDAQRMTLPSPDAIEYQVLAVKLILYTQYHMQYGQLPAR